MGHTCRKPALLCSALVLLGFAVVRVASGIAAEREASAVAPKLVGQWTRKVTSADVKRERAHMTPQDVIDAGAGIVWTLDDQEKRQGVAGRREVPRRLRHPGRANRVHSNVGFFYANVYKWRVSGRLLTLTKVNDSPCYTRGGAPGRLEAEVTADAPSTFTSSL
jgi:hypothetical protein